MQNLQFFVDLLLTGTYCIDVVVAMVIRCLISINNGIIIQIRTCRRWKSTFVIITEEKKINKNEKIWENRKTKKLSLLTLEKCKKVNRKHENIKKTKNLNLFTSEKWIIQKLRKNETKRLKFYTLEKVNNL